MTSNQTRGGSFLGDCGEPVEGGLKFAIGGRPSAGKALLVRHLGPVVGGGDLLSCLIDRREPPPPQMPWRLLARLGGSPRNAPAFFELDHVILSHRSVT